MDKLHLREKNRWENKLALVSFQYSLDQKQSPQSITRYKSVLEWSPPMGKGRGVCLRTMVSIHIFPSGQKNCIDSGLLNILVKNNLILLTVFWSQQVFIGYGYLFPAHCSGLWGKEGTFSRCVCSPAWAGQGSQLFLLCFPPQVRQASPRAKLSKGPLHSQLVLAAWWDQRNPEHCLLQRPYKCTRRGSK